MNCFVATIDLALADKLRSDLAGQGFSFSHPPHTLFAAQKKGVSCTLYASGKLTVQGKEKAEFITFYLEPEILKTVSFSYPEATLSPVARIGVDEAGKGDFFGPLCIAGVFSPNGGAEALHRLGVKDSKQLSDRTILSLSKKIRENFLCSVVRLFPQKYNELYRSFHNLNALLAWGHATAISELVEKSGCKVVIIDQFASEHLVKNALRKKRQEVELTQRHRAEEDPVVAAASILARAAFVEGIERLSQEVSFSLPKGAAPQVIEAGKQLVSAFGKEILGTVAKLHFKTTDAILGGL
jgi:ribonuclease HIII